MPLFDPIHHHGRALLKDAQKAVAGYNGRAKAIDRLLNALGALETHAPALAAHRGLPVTPPEKAEAAVAAWLDPEGRGSSAGDMLNAALERTARKVISGEIAVKIETLPVVFLPSYGERPIVPNPDSQTPFVTAVYEPRREAIVAELVRRQVPLEDIRVTRGQAQKGAMRQQPYELIETPYGEISVCNEYGQGAFVSRGEPRGWIFWATYDKRQLAQFGDIQDLPGNDPVKIVDFLMSDNAPRPSIQRRGKYTPPLTPDVIVIHALRHAEAHHDATGKWKLPNRDSGKVSDLETETWAAFDVALKQNLRNLSNTARSLNELFSSYGIKNGKFDDHEAIQVAVCRLNHNGDHGLIKGRPFRWSASTVIDLGLKHASARSLSLPNSGSGDVDGHSGQNWFNGHTILKYAYRNDPRDIAGIIKLWKFLGLLNPDGTRNIDAIQAAVDDPEAFKAKALAKLEATAPSPVALGVATLAAAARRPALRPPMR